MKNLYVRTVKYFVSCLESVLVGSKHHLAQLSDEKENVPVFVSQEVANDPDFLEGLDFETRLKSVIQYVKPPTHKFGKLFCRAMEEMDDTGKGITILIPRFTPAKKIEVEGNLEI